MTVTNIKLLQHIKLILKDYYPDKLERKEIVRLIVQRFENKRELRYPLTPNTSLCLYRDDRKVNGIRKYPNSCFPYLSNVEIFSISVGEWNEELLSYGIKTRSKASDDLTNCGTRIHLVLHNTPSSLGNRYLRNRYKRLTHLRATNQTQAYWNLSWLLMQRSWSFKLACLNSWFPLWYKKLSLNELNRIWSNLYKILNLETKQGNIYNVWIESPKGKWRQLAVPTKAWRLYLHMMNMFLSYVYEPHLPSLNYDGFIFNRGCKTWWENLLWGPLLKTFSFILEVDLSSGFPNLSLLSVRRALISDGLLPLSLVNLLLHHLRSPLIESVKFPTFETFVENCENLNWRKSCRSVHMGLGISPLLFVITLNWYFKTLGLTQLKNFNYKSYADDISFYFDLTWLLEFYKKSGETVTNLLLQLLKGLNPILTYLNHHPLSEETGVKYCLKKSGMVRIFNIWTKPYKSLGLTLFTPLTQLQQVLYHITSSDLPLDLKGSTRGRGANFQTGKAGTPPCNQLLNYKHHSGHSPLNLTTLLLHYRSYFGLLMSKLYSSSSTLAERKKLNSDCVKRSLLWILLRGKVNYHLPRPERLNIYNCGSKLNNFFLSLISSNNLYPIYLIQCPNVERLLKPKWKSFSTNLISSEIIENPLPLPLLTETREDWLTTSFKKYSELNLTPLEVEGYRKRYDEQINPPNRNA
jgi:hypothetical protein